MNQKEIDQAWEKFIAKERDSLESEGYLFTEPLCGTCKHWMLISEEELLFIKDRKEYSYIIKGMQGSITKIHKEDDELVDTFQVSVFHGWCKRYPPKPNSSQNPLKRSDYNTPLVSHENTCGEWAKDKY